MLESEKKIVEMMDERSPMSKYWMPLVWATNIINRARKESLISSDQVVQTLLVELSDIRRRLGSLISYDTVCVPLVYTQVSILPIPYRHVYAYISMCVLFFFLHVSFAHYYAFYATSVSRNPATLVFSPGYQHAPMLPVLKMTIYSAC